MASLFFAAGKFLDIAVDPVDDALIVSGTSFNRKTNDAQNQQPRVRCVIDELSAGDDFNKNYEQFRNIFGAPK